LFLLVLMVPTLSMSPLSIACGLMIMQPMRGKATLRAAHDQRKPLTLLGTNVDRRNRDTREDADLRSKIPFGLIACPLLLAPCGTAAAQAIAVGATSSTSDAPIYIADKKGYFRDEGLDVKVVNFRSAADMVAPLGAGQIEAGAGSASAGLYNAVARSIRIKIVADKASSPPAYGGTKILVR